MYQLTKQLMGSFNDILSHCLVKLRLVGQGNFFDSFLCTCLLISIDFLQLYAQQGITTKGLTIPIQEVLIACIFESEYF